MITRHRRLVKPAYANTLHPTADPVLITTEWPIARAIQRAGAVALVIDGEPETIDLSIIQDRETWILWRLDAEAARRLARHVADVTEGFCIHARGLRL